MSSRKNDLRADQRNLDEALHIIKRLMSSVVTMDSMSRDDNTFVRRMMAHRFITPTELERLVSIEAKYAMIDSFKKG